MFTLGALGRPSSGASGIAAGAAISWTWNSADKSANMGLSGSDRTAQASNTAGNGVRGTVGQTAGNHYYEFHFDANLSSSNNEWQLGFCDSTKDLTAETGSGNWAQIRQRSSPAAQSAGIFSPVNGMTAALNSALQIGSAAIIRIAINRSLGYAWGSANSGWQGDPAAGTDPNITDIPAGELFPYFFSFSTTPIVTVGPTTVFRAPAGFLIG
jgi:hypothetical protein